MFNMLPLYFNYLSTVTLLYLGLHNTGCGTTPFKSHDRGRAPWGAWLQRKPTDSGVSGAGASHQRGLDRTGPLGLSGRRAVPMGRPRRAVHKVLSLQVCWYDDLNDMTGAGGEGHGQAPSRLARAGSPLSSAVRPQRATPSAGHGAPQPPQSRVTVALSERVLHLGRRRGRSSVPRLRDAAPRAAVARKAETTKDGHG